MRNFKDQSKTDNKISLTNYDLLTPEEILNFEKRNVDGKEKYGK